MRYYGYMKALRGMSLVDVIVGTAMILIVFVALLGLMRASILISGVAKARAGATAIADSQIEYIRALDYDAVGTVGGIPAGVVLATSTQSLNGIQYSTRTLIAYVDDAADGLAGADSNSITTDYKRIKVEVTYSVRGTPRTVSIVTNYAPPSIETTTNGGTLSLSIVNAAGVAVPGATVVVSNSSTSPVVNFSTFSDASGTVQLPGAPTSTEYRILVSKTGYSTATTYARDTTNQNPTPGYLTVVKNQTTSGTFAIDYLSTLIVKTLYPILSASTTDLFTNSAQLASQSNTQVSGGAVTLLSSGSGYALSGTAVQTIVTPTYLSGWTQASSTSATPAGTSIKVYVVDGTGALLPDAVLAGNSAGFSTFPINLSTVSTSTYPSLALSANLSSNSTTTTPQLLDWRVTYLVGPVPVPNVPYTLTGAKTIGSTGGGSPLYKTTVSTTTDSVGVRTMSLEWDSYKLDLSSFDVIDACTPPSYALSPNTSYSNTLYLGAATTNTVLVSVRDNNGVSVSGADVTLSKTGYTKTVTTTACGTAYFGGLTSGTYSLSASKTGYTTTSYTNVSISGHTFYAAVFP